MVAKKKKPSVLRQTKADAYSPLFLGPQAENAELFEMLVRECLSDHKYWRRNFHAEDPFVIHEDDKLSPVFQERVSLLREELNTLLQQLKRNNIPFSNPRYIGHMLGDQLIPAILAYFATMLYNPNNVTAEASPATTKIELMFGRLLAGLMGYRQERAWGHITSGGTTATLEALWVARNLKYFPLAVKIAADKLNLALQITLPGSGPTVSTQKLEGTQGMWTLLNLDTEEILSLRGRLLKAARASGVPREEVYRQLHANSLGGLGFDRHRALTEQYFKREPPKYIQPAVVIAPSTAHYSLAKASEILGLGRSPGQLRLIPVDQKFRMDARLLAVELERCLSELTPVIAVVSVLGTTEEAAIDPIDEIANLKDEFSSKGLGFYHHCDAAYGGYIRALLYDSDCDEEITPEPVQGKVESYRTLWPSPEVLRALKATGRTDSITIDPHKLGYVPYPAGAVVYRSHSVTSEIEFSPTYLREAFIGGTILEGSKPGAAASACWLAQKVLPLDSANHGALLRENIRNALSLVGMLQELDRELKTEDIVLRVITNPPDMNIVCFLWNTKENKSLLELNVLNRILYEDHFSFDKRRAISDHSFIISLTDFPVNQYREGMGVHLEGLVDPAFYTDRDSQTWDDGVSDDKVTVLRATVMNPWLGSERDGRLYYLDLFLKDLKSAICGLARPPRERIWRATELVKEERRRKREEREVGQVLSETRENEEAWKDAR